eukprot:1454045-Prymnesium_polylepis.2
MCARASAAPAQRWCVSSRGRRRTAVRSTCAGVQQHHARKQARDCGDSVKENPGTARSRAPRAPPTWSSRRGPAV